MRVPGNDLVSPKTAVQAAELLRDAVAGIHKTVLAMTAPQQTVEGP